MSIPLPIGCYVRLATPDLQALLDRLRSCEYLIRNYDPRISCTTHFLKLRLERREQGERV